MENDILNSDIKFLTGVGPKKAELFNKELQIYTNWDLINYFPYKHIDRSKFFKIKEINSEMASIQIIGKINNFRAEGPKNRERLIADLTDESGTIELLWFQGVKWVKQNINPDKQYIIFGKPSIFNGQLNIIHPEIDEAGNIEQKLTGALQAVYSIPEK